MGRYPALGSVAWGDLMVVLVEADRLPAIRAILASGHVVEVDEGGGFCASVFRCAITGHTVARLDRSIRGAPHEGRVLRWAMEHCTRGRAPGYFRYILSPDAAFVR